MRALNRTEKEGTYACFAIIFQAHRRNRAGRCFRRHRAYGVHYRPSYVEGVFGERVCERRERVVERGVHRNTVIFCGHPELVVGERHIFQRGHSDERL